MNLKEEVDALKAERDRLFPIMRDSDRAYWDADAAWKKKQVELFKESQPVFYELGEEVKLIISKVEKNKKLIIDSAKSHGVEFPPDFWD